MLAEIRRLIAHSEWADRALFRGLQSATPPPEAIREFAHILGAAETWLSRLERRTPRTPVWPDPSATDLAALLNEIHTGYAAFAAAVDEAGLVQSIAYTNSAGQSFDNRATDIVMQAVTHSQYHRGKVNLLLRQAGLAPVPADYIAFIRGALAATHAGPPPIVTSTRHAGDPSHGDAEAH